MWQQHLKKKLSDLGFLKFSAPGQYDKSVSSCMYIMLHMLITKNTLISKILDPPRHISGLHMTKYDLK